MLHIMNSLMMPRPGLVYRPELITADEARKLFYEHADDFRQYIGYPNACKVLNQLFGTDFKTCRDKTQVKAGDTMLAMTLRYRVDPHEKRGNHGADMSDYDFYVCTVDRF